MSNTCRTRGSSTDYEGLRAGLMLLLAELAHCSSRVNGDILIEVGVGDGRCSVERRSDEERQQKGREQSQSS